MAKDIDDPGERRRAVNRERQRKRQRSPEWRAYQNEWRRRKRVEDPEWRERERLRRQKLQETDPEVVRARRRAWYRRHKDAVRAAALMRKFGITVAEYDSQRAAQGGVCAICGSGKAGGRGKVFAVDHEHGTGHWRGLLCQRCNCGIGHLHDNPELAERAALYLEAHRAGS